MQRERVRARGLGGSASVQLLSVAQASLDRGEVRTPRANRSGARGRERGGILAVFFPPNKERRRRIDVGIWPKHLSVAATVAAAPNRVPRFADNGSPRCCANLGEPRFY